jgi:hypothetical protein
MIDLEADSGCRAADDFKTVTAQCIDYDAGLERRQ